MTHVFIVNDKTFKIHLEYMFAGTGCSSDAEFYENSEYVNPKKKEKENDLTTASERNVVAMIADVSRIRTGDKIIFYLQATSKHSGRFFGVFKAKSNSFYSPNTEDYLNSQLGKNLNFRVLIEPDEVYAKGVSEHEVLDNLDGIKHPSEMCWSLIYRKLKGNRGCTMITNYESDRLIEKIKAKNSNTLNSDIFSYNESTYEIIKSESDFIYTEKQDSLSITDRMLYKANNKKAFEVHLQAYIMQNFDKESLKDYIKKDGAKSFWIGNEVSCGVGMQRIDVMTTQEDDENVYINIVELKYVNPYKKIIEEQLPWYIDWVKDYIVPLYANKKVVISPTIIAKKFYRMNQLEEFKTVCSNFLNTSSGNINVLPVTYIAFEISDKISFEKVF